MNQHDGTPLSDLTPCVVITADQRASRTSRDAVPDALEALAAVGATLAFVRTAGDEIQGVLTSPDAAVAALAWLLRDGRWHVGVGLGSAELPLPVDTRAGRGTGFVAARSAVEASATGHARPSVVAGEAGSPDLARSLESTLWLWDALLASRTAKGWEVCDLLVAGSTHREAAERLGIAQSAVTQRATAARLQEVRRAEDLCAQIVGWHLDGWSPSRL